MSPAPGFRAFTLKANGRFDRIITKVATTPAYDPAHPPSPLPAHVEVDGLWDTGATKSVLASSTAAALGLTPTGTVEVSHAGGKSRANTYVVNLRLPNRVMAAGVLVSDCDYLRTEFGAIIGMDIITAGDFSVTNVGARTWVSFRIPSVRGIDYVQEAKSLAFAGVGRNDPCPCGSGKKFKKCHGVLAAGPQIT